MAEKNDKIMDRLAEARERLSAINADSHNLIERRSGERRTENLPSVAATEKRREERRIESPREKAMRESAEALEQIRLARLELEKKQRVEKKLSVEVESIAELRAALQGDTTNLKAVAEELRNARKTSMIEVEEK